MDIYKKQQELIKTEKVRVLVTSKISGYFGIDIYIPKKDNGQPFERISGTMSIKSETYEGALEKGIEFYEEYKKDNL